MFSLSAYIANVPSAMAVSSEQAGSPSLGAHASEARVGDGKWDGETCWVGHTGPLVLYGGGLRRGEPVGRHGSRSG